MLVFCRCCTHLISHPTDSRWLKSLSAKQVIHVTIHAHKLSNMVAERGASHFVNVLVPLIMEEIVKAVKAVPLERISERICERIADVHVSQIVEQVTAEQIFDVPGLEMAKQLVEVPETVSQERIQQRTVEQIVDVPVPQVVEELMEVSHVFPQDRVHQRFVEQIIEAPAISLDEQIVEVSVIRMQGKAQQGVNTHVQHVVDTVEVEKPKITVLTVQRKKPIIQENMIQVTKPIEFPQAQFSDKAGDMLVGMQQDVSMAHSYSSPTRSSITLSWCRDRCPRRLFIRA